MLNVRPLLKLRFLKNEHSILKGLRSDGRIATGKHKWFRKLYSSGHCCCGCGTTRRNDHFQDPMFRVSCLSSFRLRLCVLTACTRAGLMAGASRWTRQWLNSTSRQTWKCWKQTIWCVLVFLLSMGCAGEAEIRRISPNPTWILSTGSLAVASRLSDNGRDSGSMAGDGSCQGQGPSKRNWSQQFCSGACFCIAPRHMTKQNRTSIRALINSSSLCFVHS